MNSIILDCKSRQFIWRQHRGQKPVQGRRGHHVCIHIGRSSQRWKSSERKSCFSSQHARLVLTVWVSVVFLMDFWQNSSKPQREEMSFKGQLCYRPVMVLFHPHSIHSFLLSHEAQSCSWAGLNPGLAHVCVQTCLEEGQRLLWQCCDSSHLISLKD